MADPLRSDRRSARRLLVAAWAFAATIAGCGSDKGSTPTATADTALPAAAMSAAAAPTTAAPTTAVTQASWAPDALEELLAPIALYPDALLSQILAASVNSQEVLDGGNWLLENENLQGDALDKAAEKAGFGPAMRALVQFPTVVDMMCQQIDWTKQIGSAFSSDQASVLDAVQRLRAQAKEVGNLKSTPQQTVETKTENNKVIVEVKPADPQVIYVPQYDPQVVYTTPPATTTTTTQSSGVSTGAAVAGALLAFGVGIMVGNAFHDDYYYPHWGYGSVYFGPRPFYPPAYVYRPVYGPAFRPAYRYTSPPGYRYNYTHVNVNRNVNVNVNNNYFNRFDNNQNLRGGKSNSPLAGTKHGVGGTQRAGQTAGNRGEAWKGQSTYAGAKNPATQARLNEAAGKATTAQNRQPQRQVGGSGGTRNPSLGSQHVDRGYGGSTRSPSKDIATQARPVQKATPRPATNPVSRPASKPDKAFSGARTPNSGSFDRAASARGHASAGSRPHPAHAARRR